jgi:hypothetical protein
MKNDLPYVRTPVNLLPPSAVMQLQSAAMIDPEIPVGMSYRRQVALDAAIESVKRKHPQYFKID